MTEIEEVLIRIKKIDLVLTTKINYMYVKHYHIADDSSLATLAFDIHTDQYGNITRVIFTPGFYSFQDRKWHSGKAGLEKSLSRYPKLAFLLDLFKSL